MQNQQSNQELSPISPNNARNAHNLTHPNSTNFVKSLRNGWHNKYICVYQQKPYCIQIRNRHKQMEAINQNQIKQQQQQKQICNDSLKKVREIDLQYSVGEEKRKVVGYDLSLWGSAVGEIYMESVPYDCLQYAANMCIASTQNMPPRVYQLSSQQHQLQQQQQQHKQHNSSIAHVHSFKHHKKNSQKYLSPLQFSQSRPDCIVGGGRRFLACYNLQKMETTRIESYDKTNVSAVQMIDGNVCIVGTYQGVVDIVDFRMPHGQSTQTGIVGKMRPHVDAVLSLASPINSSIFATSARKDNYTYIWDIRSYNQHKCIEELYSNREGNQRISLQFSTCGDVLYSGSEEGCILGWRYKESAHYNDNNQKGKIQKYVVNGKNVIVNGVILGQGENQHSFDKDISQSRKENGLIFSTGTRWYPRIIDQEEQMKMDQETNCGSFNILGYLPL